MLVLMMSKFMQTLVMQIKIYKILKQKIEDLRFFLSLFFQPYALYYSQVIQKPKNQQIYYTLSQQKYKGNGVYPSNQSKHYKNNGVHRMGYQSNPYKLQKDNGMGYPDNPYKLYKNNGIHKNLQNKHNHK